MSQNEDLNETFKKATDEYQVNWDVWEKHIAPYKSLNWEKVSKNRHIEILGIESRMLN